VDGGGELLFLLGVGRHPARGDLAARVLFQGLGDQRPGELPLVLAGHRGQAGRGVHPALLAQPVADLGAQPLDDGMVHQPASPAGWAG